MSLWTLSIYTCHSLTYMCLSKTYSNLQLPRNMQKVIQFIFIITEVAGSVILCMHWNRKRQKSFGFQHERLQLLCASLKPFRNHTETTRKCLAMLTVVLVSFAWANSTIPELWFSQKNAKCCSQAGKADVNRRRLSVSHMLLFISQSCQAMRVTIEITENTNQLGVHVKTFRCTVKDVKGFALNLLLYEQTASARNKYITR